jgi:hypothetical protein
MSLQGQISRFQKKRMGLSGGSARFIRVSDQAEIFGFLSAGRAFTNPWYAENVRIGVAAVDVEISNGDLILDVESGRHFYVVALDPQLSGGIVVRYEFQAWMATDSLSWQRLTEGAPDEFTGDPGSSSYQAVQSNIKALISNDRIYIDQKSYTEEDLSQYAIYHNFSGAMEGDLVVSDRGKKFLVKVNDFSTFASGGLVKSICVGGDGG